MRWSLSILGSAALVFGIWGYANAAETTGKVVAVEGDTIRIAIESGPIPRAGDPVEVYFELEGVDAVAKVATGKVAGAQKGRVTARLDHVQGKVQQGMSARISASPSDAPEGPAPSAAAAAEAVVIGTVNKVEEKTIHISIDSGGPPQVGDAVVFCFKIPGTQDFLRSGGGKVTAVAGGQIIAQLADGFALPGHFARISTGIAATRPPKEQPAAPSGKPAEKAETAQTAAVKAIEALGGKVTRLQDGRVFVVDLSDTETGDAGLVNLEPLVDVAFLSLENTKTTDEGMRHLRPLGQLEWLSLGGTKISDQGLVHLSGLARLGALILRDTAITDRGLAHLESLKKLELLDVGGTQVTQKGVESLKGALAALKTLIGVGMPRGPLPLPSNGSKEPRAEKR
ncbi:MAG: hypothetical protein ACOX1P_28940 [Thermoguttaceae bacterium]|jgi:hypothetical protein